MMYWDVFCMNANKGIFDFPSPFALVVIDNVTVHFKL